MRGSDLAANGARALIIATATHSGSRLPPVPSAERSARALADRLVRVCGMPAERVRLIVDPASSLEIAHAVTEAAAEVTTTLFVHYVGHGLRGPGGELYLAATNTDELTPGLAGHQAYPYLELRQALGSARASALVVVLDCCFSGRAQAGLPVLDGIFDSPPVHGFYLLGSAEQLALAPAEATYTAFTGELIGLLDRGDPRSGALLTLDDTYDHLFQAMRARGAPLPRRQEGGRTGRLVLAPNPAFAPTVRSPDEDTGPQSPGRSPYLGLAPFGEADARLFHGRDRTADELFDAVRRRQAGPGLLLVVGASGSGKSSLVQAGLLPRVRQLSGWRCTTITPGERPVERLAAALGVENGSATTAALLDPSGAADWLPDDDRPTLVVVDQLEEMLTLCPAEEERAAFAGALAALGDTERAVVVGVLRADFYAHATGYPEFAEALRERQFLVEPMDQEQLRAAIEQPARVGGLRLDDALPDLILTELGATRRQGAEPGALPLMSHALWATWQRRRGDRLTVRDYREIGGIGGAIAKSADDVLDALDEPAREAVRRMLPRLVRVGEDTADTALRLDRADLVRGLPVEAAATALRALADARLITTDQDVTRISHETLLVSWPTLRDWIEADRHRTSIVQRLASDARAWSTADRTDPALLYRGSRLTNVLDQARITDEVDERSAAFLRASQRQERRSSRLRRGALAGLVTLLVASLLGGFVAVLQARENSRQARAADARNLVSTVDALRSTDPRLALQLGVAAHGLDPTAVSSTALVETLTRSRYAGALPEASSPVSALALSLDGTRLAVGTREGLQLWDFRDPRRPVRIGEPLGGFDKPITAVAWHPSSAARLVATDESKLHVLDTDPNGRFTHVGSPLDVDLGTSSISWSADAKVLVVDTRKTTFILTSTGGGYEKASTIGRLREFIHPQPVLSRDGTTLVTGTDAAAVQLWDLTDPRSPRPRGVPLTGGGDFTATAVALSSDDRMLAVGTEATTILLWDISAPSAPRRKAEPRKTGLGLNITRLAFDRTDGALVIADVLGSMTIMRFTRGVDPLTLALLPIVEPNFTAHTGEISDLLVDDSHGLIVSGGDDGATRLWQLDDTGLRPTRSDTPLPGHRADSRYGRIDVKGDVATSTGTDGILLVWDIDDHRGFTPRPAVRYTDETVLGLINRSALSPDGRTVATYGSAGEKFGVQLWDIPAEGPPVHLGDALPASGIPLAFAWDGEGRTLVTGTLDGTVVVHDTVDRAAPREVTRFKVDSDVNDVHLSDDRALLAVSTSNGTIDLRDLRNPADPVQLGSVYTGLSGNSRGSSALSRDGKLLAIGQLSGSVRLLSLDNPRAPVQYTSWNVESLGLIPSIAFSSDGTLIAASTAVTVELWDISNRSAARQIGVPLSATDRATYSLAFAPDHDMLVGQGRGNVDLWDLSMLPQLHRDGVRVACERLGGRSLPPTEWARFLPNQEYRETCP
ncbi:hypothetical protein AB0I60_21650 [Actinosynnema sp. NPDC050436]|uniref:caspase, EACC1-associated type n=1 Tax=Actinosynnema sp. NPDC050436 TaxID=3155659 RepID=UPI0033C2999F